MFVVVPTRETGLKPVVQWWLGDDAGVTLKESSLNSVNARHTRNRHSFTFTLLDITLYLSTSGVIFLFSCVSSLVVIINTISSFSGHVQRKIGRWKYNTTFMGFYTVHRS